MVARLATMHNLYARFCGWESEILHHHFTLVVMALNSIVRLAVKVVDSYHFEKRCERVVLLTEKYQKYYHYYYYLIF